MFVFSEYLILDIQMIMRWTRLYEPHLGYVFLFTTGFVHPLLYFHHLKRVLITCTQGQKKRVAEEEAAAKKVGLGIRLLPPSTEDAATAASVKFAHKFDKNRRDKRAMIYSGSIFGSSGSSKHSELESKRRKINASAASKLLVGGFKPSSWSEATVPSKKRRVWHDPFLPIDLLAYQSKIELETCWLPTY